jgi:imidazole glycerol phosphate synthase glutamine amidotransferase subunit
VIALVDYGAGNLTSVRKALGVLGADVVTPREPEALSSASGIIVPGVGHFDVTRAIDTRWREAINEAVSRGIPLLGICVGLQWLFEGSEEAPGLPGLGLFPGLCGRLPGEASGLKVPHVGWNALTTVREGDLLSGIGDGAQVYFTHSYAAPVVGDTAAVTSYGVPFSAAVERGHVSGVQFHPEKSGDAGIQILRNWLGRVHGANVDERRAPSPKPQAPGLSKRVIACLDVRDGKVVKGVNFEGLRDAGDPSALAAHYNRAGIDELVILDVTATLESRQARAHTIASVAREIFIPLCVGGGIRSEDDAAAAYDAGADKVSVNTAALENPSLITTLAARYGSQAVVVAVDAKRADGRFVVFARSGQSATSRDAVEWANEAAERGAGEILLTSIDKDGTKSGFDCAMTAAVSTAVQIPVIASGGAGGFEHFAEVFVDGRADAALAASIFHFNEHSVADLKRFLAERGIPVRHA